MADSSQSPLLDPPALPPKAIGLFEKERQAFHQLLPSLLRTHRGTYVAIHGGQVVAQADTLFASVDAARRAFGRVPTYVDLVTDVVGT